MIEGQAEGITDTGVVLGWARDPESPSPCLVQIRLHGQVVAEALADRFRGDLLEASKGHGHHGFEARLRVAPPPGRCRFELYFPRTGQAMLCEAELPAFTPQPPVRVETLLAPARGWSAATLAAHAWCLSLEENLAEMGPARFIDSVFRFGLDRWPGRDEAAVHVAALRSGQVGAIACFLDILTSREQADRETPLPSPYNADFPFRLTLPPAADAAA